MKKAFIIHPILFAAYPALVLFSRNMFRIPVIYSLMVIAIIVLSTSLLWLLLNFILKDTARAALVTSLLVIWFFFFGPVFVTIRTLTSGGFFILRHKHFFPAWSIVFVLVTVFVITKRAYFNNVTKILNFVSVSLILFCLIDMGRYGLGSKIMFAHHKANKNIGIKKIDNESPKSQVKNIAGPDIYYIILDSYSSYSALKKFYNFDNHEFYEYLTQKGFYIAQRSRSNYATTWTSLSSSLNMGYINRDTADADRGLGLPTITPRNRNNRLMNIFQSMGYKCISVGFPNRYADLSIVYKNRNDFSKYIFYKYLLEMTPLYKLSEIYLFSPGSSKEDVLYYLNKLTEITTIKGPKFVFAYIPSPHPPFFVFGPNGEGFSLNKIFQLNPRRIYIYQLIFINKKLEELIDIILSKSKNPPVIILQSDHGCTIDDPSVYQLDERWLTERMTIFNAYYLPGNGKMFLYDSITPVNTFRVILNHYFNANYELLKDESWLSPYGNQYQKFINVTHKIKDIP